ncbi:Hsp70 family protein [Actinophytocola oryzae]|uniref:Hsp70 protein n=1 Tax=Actinophytocola oryzae TaxID=502181 RepID=A0A4R7UWS5_9PSEU|nr:Hsp70 family protein [Actinophytocola oryzae]TDV40442.1 Hsp70 protein [Actinophytocola oryzae]
MSVTAVVDFGSSHTVTVVHAPGGVPRVVNVDGEPYLPSAVFLTGDDSLVVGHDALQMAAVDPSRLESRAKAKIAQREVLLGNTVVPVPTVVLAILVRAVKAAASVVGAPVDHLVLTHPAAWGPAQRNGLLAAAEDLAPQISTIVEPVGAGVWYATHGRVGVDGADRFPLGAVLAILDLGGGTTDVAVVRRERGGIVVIGRSSIPDLGGDVFDERIISYLRQTVPGLAEVLVDVSAPGRVSLVQLRELVAFRREVRRAKELLSRHDQVELRLPGGLPGAVLRRADLERVLYADIDRITAFTLRAILSAGVEAYELTALQLAGGSARIPLLRHKLAEVVPTPIQLDDQPEAVTALGACAVAVSHDEPGRPQEHPVAAPPVKPDPRPRRARRQAERPRGPQTFVAFLVAVGFVVLAIGYGVVLKPANAVTGDALATSERFALPPPEAGTEVVSGGDVTDGLVTGRLDAPVRVSDGDTDLEWTVREITDPATDELVRAGARKPLPDLRWVLVDTSIRARARATAPYFLRDTFLADDRGLLIPAARDQPLPCPTETPGTLDAGDTARQCLAFAVSVRTRVSAVVISRVTGGEQVGARVPVDGATPAGGPVTGRALPLGAVRPLWVGNSGVRAAIVDVVTRASAYVSAEVVDRPGHRAVLVRAVVDSPTGVSVPDLAARLLLRDDRSQPVSARQVSDRGGCAVGTASGRFTVCAVFVVPSGMPLGSVAWSGDDSRPFLWQLP